MMTHDHRVQIYLLGLSRLCAEVAREPALLPWFVQLIVKVPPTLLELRREARRIAA
jgi:hypothetical protein